MSASRLMDGQTKELAPLVQVDDLHVAFPVRGGLIFNRRAGWVRAVDGVSLDLHRGETLGLVGESGCGKTTLGRAVIGLVKPTTGSVRFDASEITELGGASLQAFRQRAQIIFQDPYSSLHPRMSIEWNISEPLKIHRIGTPAERRARVEYLLEKVGLNPSHAARYPHEFSGGQRQRVGIARALASAPEFIVCDEPVSALDVSIQAQIVNLLQDLQAELGLTYLFISHDMRVVRHISSRVAVMYLGRIIELSDTETVYTQPLHPYTRALLSAVPLVDPTAEANRQRVIIEGDVQSPANMPPGCRFHARCPFAKEICRVEEPPLSEVMPGHQVACHFWDTVPALEWAYTSHDQENPLG